MHYPDGGVYDGHWEDNDKNGVGIYTYPNGDTYEGEWKDDQKHGKGIYTYKQTNTYFKGNLWSKLSTLFLPLVLCVISFGYFLPF